MKSTLFTLKTRDWIKGLLMALFSPLVPIIIQSISQKVVIFDWYVIRLTAIGAFSAYIGKNLLTDDVKQAQKVIVEAKKDELKAAAPNDMELKNQ